IGALRLAGHLGDNALLKRRNRQAVVEAQPGQWQRLAVIDFDRHRYRLAGKDTRAVEGAQVGDADERVLLPPAGDEMDGQHDEAVGEQGGIPAARQTQDQKEKGQRHPGVAEDAITPLADDQTPRFDYFLERRQLAPAELVVDPGARCFATSGLFVAPQNDQLDISLQHQPASTGTGTASTSSRMMSSGRRPRSRVCGLTTSRWVSTWGAIAFTSSGMTKSRLRTAASAWQVR